MTRVVLRTSFSHKACYIIVSIQLYDASFRSKIHIHVLHVFYFSNYWNLMLHIEGNCTYKRIGPTNFQYLFIHVRLHDKHVYDTSVRVDKMMY